MSRDPIRLESTLTRDFIDRNEKMREFHPRDPHVSKLDLVATWILLAGLLAWIGIAW